MIPLMFLTLAPGSVLAGPPANPPGESQARDRVPRKVLVQRRRAVHERMDALRGQIRGIEEAMGKARNETERRQWQGRLDDRRRELAGLERLDLRLARAISKGRL